MDPIAQIKARLPIAEVIGTYIKLERAGGNFRALCPFHKEKTPSFNVSPARDAYYCFGCARGGDLFNFVQEIEGLSFPEALRMLADKAGVTLPEKSTHLLDQQKSAKDRLIELMEVATQIFIAEYKRNPEVKDYLHGRGLTDETIEKFRIGFAPLAWRNMYDTLRAKGFSDSEIERSRIVKKVEGKGYYDTFRGRVMFPITDSSGRVIAFTGRVFGEQKAPDGTPVAKYLNSPEGELYDKSSILFGYDRAKVAMRRADVAILVEGQMDCIMSHQAGAEHTVAISGTALTQRQIDLIQRLTNKIIFALDADTAGDVAKIRSEYIARAQQFVTKGLEVKALSIPDGKDPAEYIASHPGMWSTVLETAVPIEQYLLNSYLQKKLTQEEMRRKVQQEVLPLIATQGSKIVQSQMIQETARILGVRDEDVRSDLMKIEREAVEELKKRIPSTDMGSNVQGRDESNREIGATPFISKRRRMEEELLGIVLLSEAGDGDKSVFTTLRKRYENICQEFDQVPINPTPQQINTLIIVAETQYPNIEKLPYIAEELLDRIERELIREKQEMLLRNITEKEKLKDDITELFSEYRSLGPRIVEIEDRIAKRILPL